MATKQRQNLGQGWWEMEDANGRVYYANKQTKQTSWKKPNLDADVTEEPKATRQSATKESSSKAATRPAAPAPAPAPAPAAQQEVWREVTDKKSGRTYYYNKETKETRWTNPAADAKKSDAVSVSSSTTAGAESVSIRSLFTEKVDPQSGRSYWVNLKTRATSWAAPDGWHTADDAAPPAQSLAAAATVTATAAAAAAAASSEDEGEEDPNAPVPAADGTQAGVGLFFDTDTRSGGCMVKAIYSGSSAARSQKVAIGDVLLSVNGQEVKSQGPSIVRLMIVGPQGSYVTLGFCKAGKPGDTYDVKLLRGSAESIAVLAAKGLELHAEIDALTDAMKTIESQLADERTARREESSKYKLHPPPPSPPLTRLRYRVMEGTMKDAWEEEKQRLTAAIEREKKLRRDSEMRERRLLDDRLAEALSEGDGMGLKVTRD